MKILKKDSNIPQQPSLILGYFDGIHAGHRDVIRNCPRGTKVLVTFSSSPAEYFGKNISYIYKRMFNYNLIEELGVDYIYEQDFSKIADMTAEEYLNLLIKKFNPSSVTTGFNHTFGANKQGNPEFLEKNKTSFEYFCTPPTKLENEIVSSTRIKELLALGEIEKANRFLVNNFTLESKVIKGAKLGRKLGFPTANLKYPEKIVKIPYGVYKIRVLSMPAVMNWGIKPTIGSKEVMEVHIPNYEGNLYGKKIEIEVISKIRDEKKFDSLEDLKKQIEKDVQECLK